MLREARIVSGKVVRPRPAMVWMVRHVGLLIAWHPRENTFLGRQVWSAAAGLTHGHEFHVCTLHARRDLVLGIYLTLMTSSSPPLPRNDS
jgi:hypothetical protein